MPKRISDPLFKGTDSLSLDQWKHLQIANSADAPRRLLDNWSGTVMGYLTCRLTNDHEDIDQMLFSLVGALFTDFDGLRLQANKYWEVDASYTFEIPSFDAALFSFKSGTLQSELLDHTKIRVDWFKDGVKLTHEQLALSGIPGFSLRFYAVPNAPTWMGITIVLYPLPKSQLLEQYPVCLNPAFPGLRIYSAAHCYLGFATKQLFDSVNPGTPILPCVLAPQDLDENPVHPSTGSLLKTMAATLRTAVAPATKKDLPHLNKKYEEILLNGEAAMRPTAPASLWPTPPERPTTAPQGRHVFPIPPFNRPNPPPLVSSNSKVTPLLLPFLSWFTKELVFHTLNSQQPQPYHKYVPKPFQFAFLGLPYLTTGRYPRFSNNAISPSFQKDQV